MFCFSSCHQRHLIQRLFLQNIKIELKVKRIRRSYMKSVIISSFSRSHSLISLSPFFVRTDRQTDRHTDNTRTEQSAVFQVNPFQTACMQACSHGACFLLQPCPSCAEIERASERAHRHLLHDDIYIILHCIRTYLQKYY